MAIMKMSADECVTKGERYIYNFLAKYLSDDFKIYTNVLLLNLGSDGLGSEDEVDFIIFHKRLGLLVAEVKDWQVDQIQDVDPYLVHFTFDRIKKNPNRTVYSKSIRLRNTLGQHPEFLSYDHHVMPIHGCCFFPNIRLSAWQQKLNALYIRNAQNVGICERTALFKEDFDEGSPLVEGCRAHRRLSLLRRKVTYDFEWSDGHEQMLDEILGAQKVCLN